MIFGFFSGIASITGYILAAHYWLKVPFRLSPLFVFCSLIIFLFWAALSELLLPVTLLLFGAGGLLCIIMLIIRIRGQCLITDAHPRDSLFLLTFLITLAFVCALAGHLSVIDDYAYWAIISKSITFFNSLPTAETSIFARHLTYTPGLALFHYYFSSAFSGFHLHVAYFGQNLFLIALLFALTDQQDKRTSLILISSAIILLVLFSGSIFQKLRVDHFLSLTTGIILWIIMRNRFSWQRLLVIYTAISCLYLIKEVGFFLAIFLLLVLLLDLISASNLQTGQKKAALFSLFLLFVYLVIQKMGWDRHCAALGFHHFDSAISFAGIRSAFNFTGNSESWKAFIIFLKDIIFGPADRIKVPYIIWYILLTTLWYKIFKGFTPAEKKRHLRLFYLALPIFTLYLAMNYVMQVLIFGLGITTETTTSLSRYVNIFLYGMILFTVASSLLNLLSPQKSSNRLTIVLCTVAGLLLSGSSLPGKTKPYEFEIQQLVSNGRKYFAPESRVCISPGKTEDHYLGFRLLYQLFPTRFNVAPFPDSSGQNNLEQKLTTCDYLLIYMPDHNTKRIFSPFTTDEIKERTIFKVIPATTQATISLQRIY